jgi:hypothetical protein
MRGRRRIRLVLGTLAVMIGWSMLGPPRAPATIAEQRARLPPPAEGDCLDDPVEGVWKSHAYYPGHGQWYIFTLTIRRVPGSASELTGSVHAHYWIGGPTDEEPPACTPGGYHQTVMMPANGTVHDLRIEFGGTSWQVEQAFCGSPTTSYYPDRFSGLIEPEIQEFQSVNNDGGPMVNYPTVFRRIRCLDEETAPSVVVTPPEFYPERGGCGCGVL